MMFKKGSFEIGATVYPVAIKVTWFLPVFARQHFQEVFGPLHTL